MSTDILLRAASLMRERAEAATPGSWGAVGGAFGDPAGGPDHMRVVAVPHLNAFTSIARTEYDQQGGADAEHIASWPPAVALAVADLLDATAAEDWCCEECKYAPENVRNAPLSALVVAREYLGSEL